MTTPDTHKRILTRLDAGKSLEVGKWLTDNAAILPITPRPALAQMASEALGYDISPSTIALQGEIRGLQTGRPHKKHGPKPEVGHDKRIAQLEEDVYNLAKALTSVPTGPFTEAVLHRMVERMERAK